MLILCRDSEETIHIGDDIVIRIMEVRRKRNGRYQVRVGVQAPNELPVHRGEVYAAIKRGEPKPVKEKPSEQ